jgi:hypothetical protein
MMARAGASRRVARAGICWHGARTTLTIASMPAHLEGLSASILGRKLAIPLDRPLVIKIATTSRARGQVLISCDGGRYLLANDSAVGSSINGTPTRAGVIGEGDELTIGRDRFRLAVNLEVDHDRIGTQKVAPVLRQADRLAGLCAVCDARIGSGAAGWSDGSRSICSRCIATGVKPEHLPNLTPRRQATLEDTETQALPTLPAETLKPAPAPAPAPTPAPTPAKGVKAVRVHTPATLPPVPRPAAAASTPIPEHAIETPAAMPSVSGRPPGERSAGRLPQAREATPLGTRILSGPGDITPLANRILDPAGAERGADGATSESDRMRHSRRISASRLTAVEPAGSGREGLLSKVGRVFGRRDERYQRLEELQAERLGRLAEAGRLALGPGLGLGLGEEVVTTLLQGGSISLSASHCSTTGLEQWRALRKRLDLLDAEIAAMRRTLGLGPDPESTLQQSPTLRVDERRHQERAFAALDGLSTDELGPALSAGAQTPAEAGAPPSSGRLRPGRRRR